MKKIPEITVTKQARYWVCTAWIADDFFRYSDPFLIPNFINRKSTKHEIEVQLKFLQIFATETLDKRFLVKEFLSNFQSSLNGKQRAVIKKYLISLVQLFADFRIIESNYKIIQNGELFAVDQLTSRNITQGFVIYEIMNFRS